MPTKNVGDGTTFSMKQMVMILSAGIALSGGGAAWTVSASDAVQDEKIERVQEAVKELRKDLKETRDTVLVMGPQVEGIEEDVSDMMDDIKDILKAVNRQ